MSSFDRFWLDQINLVKVGNDNIDHNKLRFYKTIKSFFKPEPYIEFVNNRNQRSSLTRLRTSAHSLEVEILRFKVPPVPYSERLCKYCTMQVPGNEEHFLKFCETFSNQRQCFIGKLSSINPSILALNPTEQVKSMLCPATPKAANLVNKYIAIMFKARGNIDSGDHASNLTFPPHVANYTCPDISFDESLTTDSESPSSDSESEDEPAL